ncbi:SDR family oxidoreductase [Jiella sp. M17.18]|uniref:SDR family oxidoreductase n=1 Tax=Jiella sp. M17.18 TaxID=3234247 RepID=UPI0034DFE1CD
MRKAVILGAYGLIGSACLRAVKADGFAVTGVGRSKAAAMRCDPHAPWILLDIAAATVRDWRTVFQDADVVVNASGALQTGARDSLAAIHDVAIARMLEALAGSRTRFIQISAAGVSPDAGTEFFRSKARGDARIMASGHDWIILRPTLVVSTEAYGGTALLRAAAAVPLVCAKVLADSPIQTVWVEDLAAAVLQAARGGIAARTLADITERQARSFAETLRMVRAWQGFPPWRFTVSIPRPLLRAAARIADATGWLGWRSPLRTNAIRSLEDGITGDAATWEAAGGSPCRSLPETLAEIPATAQERWFARLTLLGPVAIGTLSLFWVLSGLLGFAESGPAEALLTERGLGSGPAAAAVLGGSLIDLLLGLAILYRPLSRFACLGMVAVSVAYLLGATLFAADLWSDPLGPLVKVLPGIVLALVAAALLDER